MLTDQSAFAAALEAALVPMNAAREATLAALLDAAEGWCVGHAAYLLATAWHECAFAPSGLCADPAALASAMIDGTISGKRLGQYIPGGRGDPVAFAHCRKVLIGTRDQSEEVAELAVQFAEALVAGGWI